MISPSLLSFSIWALCAMTSEASWFRYLHLGRDTNRASTSDDTSHKTQAWSADGTNSTGGTHSQYYTYSVPTPYVITPTLTSQGMLVTSMIAAYEICNTPASNTSSCSTVFQNITTSQCSTVLTAWFTSVTVTDCGQNVTFSTQSSYSLATATNGPAESSALPTGQPPTPASTTYVQSIVSYYIAPWQSLAANTPTNITVLVCKFDQAGQETCHEIREVWIIHTEYVPVTSTSTLSISTSFASPVVLLLGPSQSVTVGVGAYELTTAIEYTSTSANSTTSTSIEGQSDTSTYTTTTTVTISGQPTTITRTLSLVTPEPTTTISSTTQITSTVTV